MNTPKKVNAKKIDEPKIISKRRVTDFLPAVNNTDIIKKFFAGVGDHLFQPEQSDKLSGFIGRIPQHAQLDKEFYINEPTSKRTEYQLEPTAISTNNDTGDTENILFYEDIVNLLRLQGGIVNNHDRLFETESYSWCPPIDLDKFMNFTNYFWLNTGPDIIKITDLTDISGLLGTSSPIVLQGIELIDGMKILLTNDVEFLYQNRVFSVSGIGSSFTLTVDTSFSGNVWDDVIGWDEGSWDGPNPELITITEPDYIVMERGAIDGNAWSTGNRWYHKDDINATLLSTILSNQAQRPIIEFTKNLELYNHGTFGRNPVTVRDDITTDPDLQIVGRITPLIIDGIQIENNDTILFTNAPSLQGTWDIEGWDLENTPNGIWDQFFKVIFSAPPNDIINTTEISTGFGQIITVSGDFIAAGFMVGMPIIIQGSTDQDGEYIIGSVTPTIITLTTPFSGNTGLGLPQPTNVTILEKRIQYQNRVFRVNGIGSSSGISLTLVADGQNPSGAVTDGDQIKVLLGQIHQGKTYFWSDVDNTWLLAQNKTKINQFPLFQLYDTEAIKLQDPGKYPLSTFAGSRLFNYQINTDPRQVLDSVLGLPLKFNQFGEPIFENYLVTERYSFNSPTEEIKGFYFHRTIGNNISNDFFGNDWYLRSTRSKQYIVDVFKVNNDDIKEFELSLSPDNENDIQVFVNGIEKTDKRWSFINNKIIFFDFFNLKDHIRIRYFSSKNLPENAIGNYEIPDNLEANPDNQEITFIANSDFFTHFSEIIKNQNGLIGNPNGTNNWRSTQKDRSLGTKILQHRCPLLKLMILGSNRNIDVMRSIRYVEREYSRFRNKFLRKINEFFNDGIHLDTDPPNVWVEDALTAINIGKINEFPFAYSGMGSRTNNEPTFMPSSPSRLGIFPVFKPNIYTDLTFTTPRKVIQLHDGSIIIAFNDFRDDVILEFENNIYNSIPTEYKTEFLPDFNLIDIVETKFRKGDYTTEEFNKLLTPIIQRWAINNGLDLFVNDSFNPFDPFTFNYSKQGLPGYWRGIFKFYYDTDRPNTHPWEMFGFSMKPSWWELRYGIAPYTSSNTLLWDDMRAGRIASGPRAGIDLRFARPNAPIPVDGSGNILDPISAGIATQPGINDAKANWRIGDHGPVETVFRRSEFWSFAIAQISYLMKPARFIELGWDPKLQLFVYDNQKNQQWIDISTNDRKRHSEYFVHGEKLEDGTIFLSDGIQQWISEFVINNGQNVTTTFGNIIRNVNVELGHRMAGFIDFNTMRVLSDNFGLVPLEDISINTYLNPSIKEEVYSGVIIERVPDGWSVSGYDILDPVFKIFPSITNGRKIKIDIGSLQVIKFKDFSPIETVIPYNTIFKTQQDVFDFLISYGRYLESKGWIFDQIDQITNQTNDWTLAGKQFLFWSLGKWAPGSLIAVSPLAKIVKFSTDQGAIQSIEQVVNGLYGILNKEGTPIDPNNTFISRFESEIQIIPEETEAIYSVRIIIAEFEHVITFRNRTIFNDLIYDPLFRLRQSRLKLTVSRAGGWKGRIDAPGYIVVDNTLIPNYEKTVNDFRRYFDIENIVERPSIQNSLGDMINFKRKNFLDDLLLNRETQFQFFQGFIRQKGTKVVFDRLLRSDVTTKDTTINFFEEWALREGEFGATQDFTTIEFLLRESEWRGEPQLIEFNGSILAQPILETDTSLTVDNTETFPTSGLIIIGDEKILYSSKTLTTLDGLIRGVENTIATSHNIGEFVGLIDNRFDDVISIANNDIRWIRKPPNNGVAKFPFRNLNIAKRNKNAEYYFRTDNKTAGYPLETEVMFHVETIEERNQLFDLQRTTLSAPDLKEGDRIWVSNIKNFYNETNKNSIFNFGFMVYRFTNTGLTFSIPHLPLNSNDPTIIKTNNNHGLEDNHYIMIDKAEGTAPEINGGYLINLVTSEIGSSFNVPLPNTTIKINNIEVTLNGTNITEIIDSINAANIPNILAFEESGNIQLINLIKDDIILDIGTPASVSGQGGVYDTGSDININGILVQLNTGTAEIIGVPFATYTNGESILINGVPITLSTGNDVDSAIIDINASSIPNVIASKSNNALKISVNSNSNTSLVLSEGDTFIIGTVGATYTQGDSIIINGNLINLTSATGNAIATGTPGATYINGETIIINTITVTLSTGTTVADAIIDITSALIPNVTAIDVGGALQIIASGVDLILAEGSGTALLNLGLSVGTIQHPGTVTDAVNDITNAGIPNITAIDVGGALQIKSSAGSFILDIGSGTALTDLGLTVGSIDSALTSLGFSPGTIAPQSTLSDAVNDINAASIPNILASTTENIITISNISNGNVIIAEGSPDGILDKLGLTAGTFENSLTLLGFTPGTFSNISTNLFTINNNIQQDDNNGGTVLNGTINIFTESRFINEEERNNAITPQGNPIPWSTNEIIYVDERNNPNDIVPLWIVYEYIGSSPSTSSTTNSDWTVVIVDDIERIQNNKIDVELFKQSILFNKLTNLTDINVNIWDPAKGLFPGQILDQIDYKVEFDPAKYTNGDENRFQIDPLESWGNLQVGQVWWDLSEVEYINYESGSNRQRRNQWGKLAPNKNITIYEWVKSPVPPSQWATFVQQNENIPEESFNNKPSGEAFLSTDPNGPFVQKEEFNELTGKNDIVFYFWVKNKETTPNIINRQYSVAQITRQLTNPTNQGIPWWAPINKNAILISQVESFLTTNDTGFQINFNFTQNQNNLHRQWVLSREGDEKDVPTNRFWNKMVDSLVGFDIENNTVPDPNLEESRKLGNFIRPRQTWFINREQAGRIFIDCLNLLLKQECIVDTRPNLFDNLFNKSIEPIQSNLIPPFTSSRNPCEYDRHVSNNFERDLLKINPGLNDYEQIWVDGIPETNGFWKVYQYQPDGSFKEVCSEAFRLEDFWKQIDFVLPGINLDIPPDITVNTINEKNALPNQIDGTILKVNDANSDGLNTWALFKFNSLNTTDPWELVAKKDCVIEFDTNLFFDINYGNIDVITNRNGRDLALKELLKTLRSDILTDLEQNLLFYKMINYVHSEQLLVDWAFKTTYLFATGLNRATNQDPILRKDPIKSFIEFILDAKPYHTKLRDFIINEDIGIDIKETNVTDFDKPVYFDIDLNEFRVLDPNNSTDIKIMMDPSNQQHNWFTNYLTNSDLIRNIKTTILFDRVSCDVSGGWDPVFGWDFGPNESWDLVSNNLTETAADRIIRSYQPQPLTQNDVDNNQFDPLTDLKTLISGCDFRGTNVDGYKFNIIDINNIDTFLDGGNLINPGTPTNSSDIIIDGNLFIEPDFDSGHPEELALNTIGEAISICVSTKNIIGAPKIITRKFTGSLGAGPYSIGQTPASKEATFVYINGIRINETEFQIDVNSNTIIFNTQIGSIPPNQPLVGDLIVPTDSIIITSFSTGGAEIILETEYFAGDGINNTFQLQVTPINDNAVFVTKNGILQHLGIDYTVFIDSIVFTTIPTTTDEIIVTIFESDTFTIIDTSEKIITAPIVAPNINIFDIGQNINPPTINELDNVFVDINGIRQRPFGLGWSNSVTQWSNSPWSSFDEFKFDYIINYSTNKITFINFVEGKSNPIFNLPIAGWSNSEWSNSEWSSVTPLNDSIFINGIEVILTGITIESVIQNINQANIPDIKAAFDESNTRLKIVNIVGGPITLAEGTGQVLSDLGFIPGTYHSILKENDIVHISSMKNDFIIIREEYDGITTIYNTIQDIVVNEQINVRVNGTPITEGIDFTIDLINNTITLMPSLITTLNIGDIIDIIIYYTSTELFDGNSSGPGGVGEYTPLIQTILEPTKTFVYVNGIRQELNNDFIFTNGGSTLQFTRAHNANDKILITTMTGRESADAIAFRLFLNNINARESNKIKPLAITKLTSDITGSSSSINLESTVGFPPSGTLIIGTVLNDIIKYEFIRYNNVTTFTVDIIQRGVNTTDIINHNTNDIVLIIDTNINQLANWEAYRISNQNKTKLVKPLKITDTEIYLDRVAGLPKQKPSEIRMKTPGVIWIGNERIEYYRRDGTVLKQIRRGTQGTSSGIPAKYDSSGNLLEDGFTGLLDGITNITTLTYPIGTIVIDGSKRHLIPGGYRFEITPFGLQFSNSAQAQFLRAKPGNC